MDSQFQIRRRLRSGQGIATHGAIGRDERGTPGLTTIGTRTLHLPPPGAVEPRGFLDEWCRLFAGTMLQKTVEDSAALETFGLMEALR